jgi:hypothetical protein
VQAPTLDLYRREWTPGPGFAPAGTWIGAMVADSSGQTYWGLRGATTSSSCMTHVVSPITGFKMLPPTFDRDPPYLFAEYSLYSIITFPFSSTEKLLSTWCQRTGSQRPMCYCD